MATRGHARQAGRTIVVTGTTIGGLGFETALELARRGARVVLAGRTPARIAESEAAIRAQVPAATLEQVRVDVSDLSSVRRAAAQLLGLGPISALVNNAGVMGTAYTRTGDGLELQMATNHFGPFLLTGLLLPQLVASNDARVVTVSSPMHRTARTAPLGDPHQQQGRYSRWPVYGQTKLANLLFTFELDRRARRAELPVRALAAHPVLGHPPRCERPLRPRRRGPCVDPRRGRPGGRPARADGRPADPDGHHRGPAGLDILRSQRLAGVRGLPTVVGCSGLAMDEDAQRRLWELSEQTTGVAYP